MQWRKGYKLTAQLLTNHFQTQHKFMSDHVLKPGSGKDAKTVKNALTWNYVLKDGQSKYNVLVVILTIIG